MPLQKDGCFALWSSSYSGCPRYDKGSKETDLLELVVFVVLCLVRDQGSSPMVLWSRMVGMASIWRWTHELRPGPKAEPEDAGRPQPPCDSADSAGRACNKQLKPGGGGEYVLNFLVLLL